MCVFNGFTWWLSISVSLITTRRFFCMLRASVIDPAPDKWSGESCVQARDVEVCHLRGILSLTRETCHLVSSVWSGSTKRWCHIWKHPPGEIFVSKKAGLINTHIQKQYEANTCSKRGRYSPRPICKQSSLHSLEAKTMRKSLESMTRIRSSNSVVPMQTNIRSNGFVIVISQNPRDCSTWSHTSQIFQFVLRSTFSTRSKLLEDTLNVLIQAVITQVR